MHKLGHRDLELSDFQDGAVFGAALDMLNAAGVAFRKKEAFMVGTLVSEGTQTHEGYAIVRWMKKHLPEGFLQKITYTMSYETALNMLLQRGNHRLPEWSGPGGICEWLRTLPYLALFEKAVLVSEKAL
jgi:hypothetical protein